MKRTVDLSSSPPAKAWLVVHGGPEDGRFFALRQDTITVGKDATLSDFVLRDPSVSREHARLQRQGDQFVLTDLASSNGTSINKQAVNQAMLRDGDVIYIGSTVLVFKHVPAQVG